MSERNRFDRSFVKSAAIAGLVHGGGLALAVVSQILVARTLGPAQFGLYAALLSAVWIAVAIATFGFERAALKIVPTALVHGQKTVPAQFGDYATRFVVRGALVVAAVFALGTFGWVALTEPRAVSIGYVPIALIAAGIVPLVATVRVWGGVLRGLGSTARALLPDHVTRESIVITGVLALLMTGVVPPTANAALALVLTGAVFGLLLAWAALSSFPQHLAPGSDSAPADRAVPDSERRAWRSTAIALGLTTIAQIALLRSDAILLATVAGHEDAGQFQAVLTLANAILLPMLTLNVFVAPQMAALFARKAASELQRLVDRTILLAMAAGGAIAGMMLLLPDTFLQLFGNSFAQAGPALQALVTLTLVSLSLGFAAPLLAVTGGERALCGLTSAAVTVKCCVGLWLYGSGGVDVAVWCAGITACLLNLTIACIVFRVRRIDSSAFGAVARVLATARKK